MIFMKLLRFIVTITEELLLRARYYGGVHKERCREEDKRAPMREEVYQS